ncbi:MAG: carbonic anhydrase family protein [Rubrivivax sp.]|nr:carbonic anhydrase family protein [Rubrivivax sp.]
MTARHAAPHPVVRRLLPASSLLIAAAAAWPVPAPAAEPVKAAAAKVTAAEPGNLDRLRERLAEKLGAARPPDAPHANLLRVSARAESPAPAAGHQASPVAIARKPAPAVPAAVEAHRADKAAGHAAHWAYGGDTGPAAWGGLRPEFATCANGTRQSPIDIRGGIAVDLEPVVFDYRASPFTVLDNGHTVQANIAAGNSIVVGGRRFELVQFHFHRPAEERINGRQYDMSVHLVHKDAEGRLAVVGLLLERGAPQPVVQRVWNDLPLEKGYEQPGGQPIDLNALLPPDRGYYTYMGSLTTPPCNEGVLWMVMREPVPVSQAQIDIFSHLYPMNARPLQSAAGRLIKQSQ